MEAPSLFGGARLRAAVPVEGALCWVLLAAAAACSAGGGAAPLSSAVSSLSAPAQVRGDVTIDFVLTAPVATTHDLLVEVSRDGGLRWSPARTRAGTTGLTSTPAGAAHSLVWDSLADAGFRDTTGVRLRLTPVRGGSRGTAAVVDLPPADNLALAAAAVRTYMVHYGALSAAEIALAEQHDLVIVHPFAGALDVATVDAIKDGVDPDDPADDVLVLAYISIGEDLRTIGWTDAQLLTDPRFVGDGSGPRIDPRGPNADGQPLTGIDPLGIPSNGGTGYASWFLDDNSVDNSGTGTGDGLPDRNAIFGGAFANAGDPQWFDVLDQMLFDGLDGVPGMAELLTAGAGRGYACDGLFLDTVDTCAPNSFTNASSFNQSEFEWTAPGFRDFMARLEQRYPDKLVLQNRGLFLYDPRHPHMAVNPRAHVDFVMFESFRLNSNKSEEFHFWFYPDNRFNAAPKLVAEAARNDGFIVLSLGYAEGPAATMSTATLVGGSTLGHASLLEDITVTQDELGFRHYLTDDLLQLANRFVLDNGRLDDGLPPRWSSTYNDNDRTFPTPPEAPTPRVGVQEVVAGPGCAIVRWDVAVDFDRVSYTLYYDDQPLDFAGDPDLAAATAITVVPEQADGYATSYGPTVFANQTTVTGLTSGTRYYFCLRAADARGNEEKNQVEHSAVPLGLTTIAIDGDFADWAGVPAQHDDPADSPDSAGPDWLSLSVANDTQNLYVRFGSEHAFNLDGSPAYGFSRTLIMIDVDDDPATGYAATGAVGSELLVFGSDLYAQAAGVFNAGYLTALSVAPTTAITDCELAIPLAEIYAAHPTASRLRLLFLNDDVFDWAPDSGSVQYTIVTP